VKKLSDAEFVLVYRTLEHAVGCTVCGETRVSGRLTCRKHCQQWDAVKPRAVAEQRGVYQAWVATHPDQWREEWRTLGESDNVFYPYIVAS
jgi:hypothetical protein